MAPLYPKAIVFYVSFNVMMFADDEMPRRQEMPAPIYGPPLFGEFLYIALVFG